MPPTRRREEPLLPQLLEQMFMTSAAREAGVHRKLGSGLHVKVGVVRGHRQIILWRDGERLPGRKECEVVARDAGFRHPHYRTWKVGESDAFLVTDRQPQAITVSPASLAASGGGGREVCGSCRHAEPAEYGLVACTLGWEAHDGLWSESRKTWAVMGHAGVPQPLLTPDCRCMAVGGRWLPKAVAA